MLDKKEVNLILKLIYKEQNKIIKDSRYDSEEYLELEQLKIKIKSIGR